MNDSQVMSIATGAMLVTAKLAAPFLLTSLAIGLLVSLFQSVTQIQEVTLTFVPKLAAIALVMAIAGHWMLNTIVSYSQTILGQAGTLLGP